jgi:hypothetical protein
VSSVLISGKGLCLFLIRAICGNPWQGFALIRFAPFATLQTRNNVNPLHEKRLPGAFSDLPKH